MMGRRLPVAEHRGRPWRIHEVTHDFDVEDVWAFRTPGARAGDFPRMLAALQTGGGLDRNPPLVKALFAIRWKLGALLGWDDPDQRVGARVPTLLRRLPPDLRQDGAGRPVGTTPFTTLYALDDEAADEMANRTVHTVMHLGWVAAHDDEYELHMAALVKANGRLGRIYMALIKPFRHLIVYPALTRQWERAWRDHGGR